MKRPTPETVRELLLETACELFGFDAAEELASRLARATDARFVAALDRAKVLDASSTS